MNGQVWSFKVIDVGTLLVSDYQAEGIVIDERGIRLVRRGQPGGDFVDVAVFAPGRVSIVGTGFQLGDLEEA